MNRFSFFCALLLSCGVPESDRDTELPDGFLRSCDHAGDCDDSDDCTVDECVLDATGLAGQCRNNLVDCHALDSDCTVGVCHAGSCEPDPGHEGALCHTSAGAPGACTAGQCHEVPRCFPAGLESCAGFKTQTGMTTLGTQVLDSYACASAETGPEVGYRFMETVEREVVVKLKSAVDLDLLVLEGEDCITLAPCAGFSTTVDSGNETVRFIAKAYQPYVFVVDGKNGVSGAYSLEVDCPACTTVQALGCNLSFAGNTQSASAVSHLAGYNCPGQLVVPPTLRGPEQSFTLQPTETTLYSIKLSSLSSPHDLVVLRESAGVCDPRFCHATRPESANGDEVVSFNGYAGTKYHAVVDALGAGGAYQLEVRCPPSCANSGLSLSCDSPSALARNDDKFFSSKLIDGWSCASNTSGPEMVYRYSPTQSAMVTVELQALAQDLDLIVLEGEFGLCDPLRPCLASSVQLGTQNESLSFMAEAGHHYWIAVDGKDGAVSPFTLRLRNPTCPQSCYNGNNSLSCKYRGDRRRNDDPEHAKSFVDQWPCAANTTGPEVVYALRTPPAGQYTVTLDQLTADLDLIVMESPFTYACDATKMCTAASTKTGTQPESVTFSANGTSSYYLAVDGKNGAAGEFRIALDSNACPAPICSRGFIDMSCGKKTVTSRNDEMGATNNVDTWACDQDASGPEHVHLFSPTGTGPFTAELSGLSADLNLYVLDAGQPIACDPSQACVANSNTSGTSSERVTFTAAPGHRYFFVVDGQNAEISPYTLSITGGCP